MKKLDIKQRLITIVAFLAVAAIIGFLVMVSGIVPIKASSGHWAVTKWILDFSKSRSVATHSIGIDVPPLDDPALVMKGAGHYETGCVQCHGSPARPASPIALSMTATPPSLPPKIALREPEELFYIVKHGIKFTGMPAWPVQNRDDEVWAMVAFLLELPDMTETRYRKLTTDIDGSRQSIVHTGVSPATLQTCSRCHGHDGLGRATGAFPKLAGQNREYLLASLKAHAAGDRHSGMMQPVAAILSEEERAQLADYYSSLPSSDPSPQQSFENPDGDIQRGQTLAHEGRPVDNIPSCIDCHGPADRSLSSKYPRLAGQPADYLALQLKLFRAGTRGGTDAADLMRPVVRNLSDDDIRDLAAFYASLVPD